MALDQITFFEVHLDGTKIGEKLGSTTSGKRSKESKQIETKQSTEESSGGSRGKRALLGTVLALAIFGVVAWRRRKSSEQTTVDDYAERQGGLADSESVELDDVDA